MFHKPMLILLLSLLLLISFTACGKSPEDAPKSLAQMNIQYSDEAFIRCAEQGNIVAVRLFLDAGMNPDAKNNYGKTALMFAAQEGHTDTVQALLARGADVNAKNNDGTTALMAAQKKGYTKIVQFLKDAGAKE